MSCLTSMNPPLHFSTHIIQVIGIHAVEFLNTHFIQKDLSLFNTKKFKAISLQGLLRVRLHQASAPMLQEHF